MALFNSQGRKEREVKVKDGASDEVSRQIGESPGYVIVSTVLRKRFDCLSVSG